MFILHYTALTVNSRVNCVKDFEKLGLPEDDLARLWLAFSRHFVDMDDQTTMNGDVPTVPTC